ncbi:MAG: pilus assembly protein [Candidatus Saccharimonas sp.]|nr:pilus assembly protein [Planctomycetaceae bacterium]
MTTIRRNKHARRGAAMVEMALVLPLFLMLVLGIIEFGRAMMVANLVTNAAREGARMAVLDGSTNTEVNNAVETFLQSAIGQGVSAADIDVTITVTAAAGNPNPANNVANALSRDLITVKVQLPFNKVALIPGDYLAGKQLMGQSAMRHE